MSSLPSSTLNNNNNNNDKLLQHHLMAIEAESGEHGLLNLLKELVIYIRQGPSHKDGKKKKKGASKMISAFAPTPSSDLVGNQWMASALVKNLEYMFGVTPQRTNVMREALALPYHYKLILMRGIVERVMSQHALINDRSNTFEAVMLIISNLGPDQQDLADDLSQPMIRMYNDDFKKPFINYAGFHFRTADGSYNCIINPDVGKAGSPYARTVNSMSLVNEQLPPAHIVFERLLKRPEGQFSPHKSGINMLLFYLAIVITHDVFYTDHKDPTRNLTPGYLDLSTLYGFNRKDQESVRQMKRGLIYNDQWFDKRMVLQPPGVGALMVLFSRNHNYIVEKLLEINENGRFSYGPGKHLVTEQDQDEELFQTARLINTGCLANIIIRDYLRTILGTSQNSDFVWNPIKEPAYPIHGNQVSFEFNVIYRWHAAIGKQDEDWLNTVMTTLGPILRNYHRTVATEAVAAAAAAVAGTSSKAKKTNNNKTTTAINTGRRGDGDPNGTDQSMFEALLPAFNTHFGKATKEELAKGLPLAGARRDPETGKFKDQDLAQLLRRGYMQVAGELGHGLNIPAALAPIEIAGILQARQLKCCYFNEFRQFLNLAPLKTFEDFSENPQVRQALQELYGTPDKVELFVGILVERSKLVGIRLPYTVSRAILSDAVNLLRNDRILTQEMKPANLTNWGYQFIQGDPQSHGRVLPTLLQLHLSRANPNGDPLFTPEQIANLFTIPDFEPSL